MITPVASPPPSACTTSTTVSRKFGSGMPGRAMRNTAFEGAWASAGVASVMSATRATPRNAFIGLQRVLIEAEGRETVGPRGRAGGHRARAPEQFLPEAPRILAKHEVGVGVEHVPQAAVDLLSELARPPRDVPHVVARLVGRLLDDVVDHRALGGEEQLLHHLDRPGSGRVIYMDHREDRLPQHRAAEVDGILDHLRGRMLGEEARERATRRP